jgi:predicted Fe-Mo cluster-binding NifX family protein
MMQMKTKVAIPTDDGLTISAHFGQAHFFKIVTLEEGNIESAEIREKAVHQHGQMPAEGGHPGQRMIESIADCQVLISGGMGSPVYQRAVNAGLQVVLARTQDIDTAVAAFQAGSLQNDPQLVHMH